MNLSRLNNIIELFKARPWKQGNQLTENGCLIADNPEFDGAHKGVCYAGCKREEAIGEFLTTASPEKAAYYEWTAEEVALFREVVSSFHPDMEKQFKHFTKDHLIFHASSVSAVARFSGWCLARLLWESPPAAAYMMYLWEFGYRDSAELQQLTAAVTPGVHGYMGDGRTSLTEELLNERLMCTDRQIGAVDGYLGCHMDYAHTHNCNLDAIMIDPVKIDEWRATAYGE